MTRYFYIRCECGHIQRVLAFAIEHATANCTRCNKQLSSSDKVAVESWQRQHSSLTATDEERATLVREHLGVPLAKPNRPPRTYPSRLSRY